MLNCAFMSHKLKIISVVFFWVLGSSSSVFAQALSPSMAKVVNSILEQADQLLLKNQLTTPANRNALDRYQAALLLDPNNPRAVEGIERVGQRYVWLANNATNRGDYDKSRAFLKKAEAVIGKSTLIDRGYAAIERAKSKPPKPVRVVKKSNVSEPEPLQRKFILDGAGLKNKNADVAALLEMLGQRIQSSHEYALIYARNDAEGRWIYKQMRNATGDYRLRGDIRRSKTPRVILEPPLD